MLITRPKFITFRELIAFWKFILAAWPIALRKFLYFLPEFIFTFRNFPLILQFAIIFFRILPASQFLELGFVILLTSLILPLSLLFFGFSLSLFIGNWHEINYAAPIYKFDLERPKQAFEKSWFNSISKKISVLLHSPKYP